MKEYKRYCDICDKEINPYDIGTVTLYRDIRFGVGGMYKDFIHRDNMAVEEPSDFDDFGKRWISNDDSEFSFCCLDHCIQFITQAHNNIMKKYDKLKECDING